MAQGHQLWLGTRSYHPLELRHIDVAIFRLWHYLDGSPKPLSCLRGAQVLNVFGNCSLGTANPTAGNSTTFPQDHAASPVLIHNTKQQLFKNPLPTLRQKGIPAVIQPTGFLGLSNGKGVPPAGS